jgi:hypothetical protein
VQNCGMESPEKVISWFRSFYSSVRCEVIRPAAVKITVFLNITSCNPMRAKKRFVQNLSHPSSESKCNQRKNPE